MTTCPSATMLAAAAESAAFPCDAVSLFPAMQGLPGRHHAPAAPRHGCVNPAFYVQGFQVLTDRDLGKRRIVGQVYDQDAAFPTQQLKDRSLPLFS